MLIGGRRCIGEGAPQMVFDPANGQRLGCIPEATAEQVDAAVTAAESAFSNWRQTPAATRAALLLELADEIARRGDDLAATESRNTGKPLHLVRQDEIPAIIDCFRYFAGAARCVTGLAAGEYVTGRTSMVRRDPLGVVAQIAPWNYPLMMAAWKLAPALASGNCSVFKPSEWTPLSILALCDALAGIFPPGVVNVLTGRGASTGRAMAAHPRVRLVSLTGSVAAGKEVHALAGGNLKRTHLELGGKAPVLVFADADVDALVECLASASFYNAGQDCTAACRLYVHRSIYTEVGERLQQLAASIRVGSPDDPTTAMGPLITTAHRARVSGFVERALSLSHSRLLAGGESLPGAGNFYAPTVIADVCHDDEIVREEVFGPVVTLTPFDDEAQALRWANDSEYALGASIWTRDGARALRLIPELVAGVTWVNDHFTYTAEMPHGGMKQSGSGSDLSVFGLDDYLQTRHVLLRH